MSNQVAVISSLTWFNCRKYIDQLKCCGNLPVRGAYLCDCILGMQELLYSLTGFDLDKGEC